MKRYKNKGWLHQKYIIEKLSAPEIAKICKVPNGTIFNFMRKFKIPTRSISEASKLWHKNHPGVWRGEKHSRWKGGKIKGAGTYTRIFMPDHPLANIEGYLYEHRLVMMKKLGRYLEPGEVVHHENKNKGDNRPENLRHFKSNVEHMRHEKDLRKSREACL